MNDKHKVEARADENEGAAAPEPAEQRFHVDDIRANAAGLARELDVSPDMIAGALRTADRDRRLFTRREIERLVADFGKREA